MNPQEQPNTPTPPTTNTGFGTPPVATVNEQTPSEADAVALQAIEALESEDAGDISQPEVASAPTLSDIPAPTPVSPQPVATPGSLQTPVTPVDSTPTPVASPLETSTTGIAGAVGAQTVANNPASNYAPTPLVREKKKTSKLVVTLLVVVLVAVAAVAGYLVWQSMQG